MTFWTIMVITILTGPMAGISSGPLYSSEQACRDAIKTVAETLGYDHRVECQPTIFASSSPRPKARP